MSAFSADPAAPPGEPVDLELLVATAEQAPILANLLSLYIHDFSELLGGTPGPDGRFTYDRLPLYFEDPRRTALLLRWRRAPAGFALVSRGSLISGDPEVWDLSEFFVVRGLRRQGVGRAAAVAAFTRSPGWWEVRALDRNVGAGHFWRRTIADHTGGRCEEQPWVSPSGSAFTVFRFEQPLVPG